MWVIGFQYLYSRSGWMEWNERGAWNPLVGGREGACSARLFFIGILDIWSFGLSIILIVCILPTQTTMANGRPYICGGVCYLYVLRDRDWGRHRERRGESGCEAVVLCPRVSLTSPSLGTGQRPGSEARGRTQQVARDRISGERGDMADSQCWD